jgi:CRISPR-associated protein Cmr3
VAKQHKTKINYNKQKKLQQKTEKQAREQQTAPKTCDKGQFNFQFQALDTWFFRESRPHDAVGASELSSLFPPPVRTLMGAIRSFLGEQIGINWHAFNTNPAQPTLIAGLDFKQAVGGAEGLGQLSVQGPWVCYDRQRLYPAPFYLMQQGDELVRLQIGDPVRCDLGSVRLPQLPKDLVGYKNVEQAWVTRSGWEKLLNQQVPDKSDIIVQADVLAKEPRLGIARDNAARKVIEGRLYQTQHIRLKDHVSIELDVHGLDEQLAAVLPKTNGSELLRLGGEGRMAGLTTTQQHEPLPSLNIAGLKTVNKFIIHVITPADFSGNWFPEGFEKTERVGQTVWQGEINGIGLIIAAAVIGKVHREGGWDMQNHQPRTVKSYLPAGSAWFCEVIDKSITWSIIIEKLHNYCIGLDAAYGRGHILIGLWNDNEQHKG